MSHTTLLTLIEERTGTQLKDSRLDRAQRLLAELQQHTPAAALLRALTAEALTSPLWQRIVQEITVGETYFFRNQPQFNALRDLILPRLIAARRAQNQLYLRLWSAGCATGEEPYSLAMLLRDLLPDWRDWSLFILATDINETMLDAARAGCYRPASFRGETPPSLQARWFHLKDGLYHIDNSVRQMVTFRPLNLVENGYPSLDTLTVNHDVILCRNVTIYFSNEQTREVVNRLYGALRDEGWLLIGHAEPQLHVYDAFRMVQYDGTILYQKQTATAAARPARSSDEPRRPADHAPLPAPPVPAPVVQPVVDTPALLADARRAADREDWPTALALLEQLEQTERHNPLLHFIRALVLVQTDANAAIEALGQAVYCDPKFALGHYWQGELWAQRGVMHRAVTCWRRAERALNGIPDQTPVPGEPDLTTAHLRDLLAYRLGDT